VAPGAAARPWGVPGTRPISKRRDVPLDARRVAGGRIPTRRHCRAAGPDGSSERSRGSSRRLWKSGSISAIAIRRFLSSKSADADPLNLNRSADAEGCRIRPGGWPDSNRHEQRFAARFEDDGGALFVVEPGRGGAVGRGARDVAVAGRPDRGAAARAITRGNEFRRQEGNRHGPGAGCARWPGHRQARLERSPRFARV
jgi:hypothetical protein